jgi:hypothetical protein
MLERLVENWLDSAKERTFQGPFCQMLASQGYTILHMTRHCGMEMGKDVIARAPDGVTCAYQLKTTNGPRITLSQWQSEIQSQVLSMVTQPVVHPSVPGDEPHRSYLVTNRDIDEEVQRAIDDLNRRWKRNRFTHFGLRTVVRGEMLHMASELRSGLWPSEQRDTNSLLHMFLADGRGTVPLSRLATLLEGTLGLDRTGGHPTRSESKRRLASAALLCSVALSNYTLVGNFAREVEGLTMLMSYVLAYAERHRLSVADWKNEFRITVDSIYDRLMRLQQELSKRSHLMEGEKLADLAIHGARVTICLGYMSILGLWRLNDCIEQDGVDEQISSFCEKYRTKAELWGESAVPFHLAHFWYWSRTSGSGDPDLLIRDLLYYVCSHNKRGSESPLASPYYSYEEIRERAPGLGATPITDAFAGRSATASALLHLLVRKNMKQSAKTIWPEYSRLMSEENIPRPKWHFYRWRNRTSGLNRWIYSPLTKQWSDLLTEAYEVSGRELPRLIREQPVLLLLLLCVYPHRLTAGVTRWLDSKLGKAWR